MRRSARTARRKPSTTSRGGSTRTTRSGGSPTWATRTVAPRRSRTQRHAPVPCRSRSSSTAVKAPTRTATRSRTDWDFGDGSAPASGASVSHTYTQAGIFTATLSVSDGRGGDGHRDGQDPPRQRASGRDRLEPGCGTALCGRRDDRADGLRKRPRGRAAARQRAVMDGGPPPRHPYAPIPAAHRRGPRGHRGSHARGHTRHGDELPRGDPDRDRFGRAQHDGQPRPAAAHGRPDLRDRAAGRRAGGRREPGRGSRDA